MALFEFLANTRTPEQKLEDAVKRNNFAELDNLLQQGIDPNLRLQKYGGNTAMHFAASAGHFVCIERLIAAGAHADSPNDDDVTPFHNAVRYEHPRAMLIILKHCNDRRLGLERIWMNKSGAQMLYSKVNDDVVNILIIATPDIERTRSNLRKNILDLCRVHKHIKSLKTLLMVGYRLDAISKPIYDQVIEDIKRERQERYEDEYILSNPVDLLYVELEKELIDCYRNISKNPQPLQHYCRLAIRRSFHGNCNVHYGALQLPLPEKLKKYLTENRFFS